MAKEMKVFAIISFFRAKSSSSTEIICCNNNNNRDNQMPVHYLIRGGRLASIGIALIAVRIIFI